MVAEMTDREQALEEIIRDIWWMARRYADGRSSYAPWQYNKAIRKAIELGVAFEPDMGDICARDGGCDD
jgi:hypothetical protein